MIYARGDVLERKRLQEKNQFVYNDCMNRVQTHTLNELDKADARCCI